MRMDAAGLDRRVRDIDGVAPAALAAKGVIGAWGWIGVARLAAGALQACPADPASAPGAGSVEA